MKVGEWIGGYVGAIAVGHGARMAENERRDGTGVRGGGNDGWIATVAEMIGDRNRAVYRVGG